MAIEQNNRTRVSRSERPSQRGKSPLRLGEPSPSESTVETRTSGSSGRSCLECGARITGRRRNGFCSDRCRMRASRVAKRARVGKELTVMECKVETFAVMRSAIKLLRAELLAADGREERDQRDA